MLIPATAASIEKSRFFDGQKRLSPLFIFMDVAFRRPRPAPRSRTLRVFLAEAEIAAVADGREDLVAVLRALLRGGIVDRLAFVARKQAQKRITVFRRRGRDRCDGLRPGAARAAAASALAVLRR